MARLTFKEIKKGMALEHHEPGTQQDPRIFRVARKIAKGKKVIIHTPYGKTRDELKAGAGFIELTFTMGQINGIMRRLPQADDGQGAGWFLEDLKEKRAA